MAIKARITLLHATSHESRFGKFPRTGAYKETTDLGMITYYQSQSEFSVSLSQVARKPVAAPVIRDAPVSVTAPEASIERRPWDEKMPKSALLEEAQRRGLAVVDNDTKGAIIELLRESDLEDDEG